MMLVDLFDGLMADPYVAHEEKVEMRALVTLLIERLGEINALAQDRAEEDVK